MPIGDDGSLQEQSKCQQCFIWVITQKINISLCGNVLSCSVSGLLQSIRVAWLGVCKDCVTFMVYNSGVLPVNFLPKKTEMSFWQVPQNL